MTAFGKWADFKRVGGRMAEEERSSRETVWRVGHGVSSEAQSYVARSTARCASWGKGTVTK